MNKINLNAAFKEMRKVGLIAKQNFSCCGNCAGYEIVTDLVEKIKAKPAVKNKVKGCVFYHHQSAALLRERGYCYLNYGSIGTSEFGEIGLSTVEVGKLAVEILTKHGVPVEWDGNPNSNIKIGEDRRIKRVVTAA